MPFGFGSGRNVVGGAIADALAGAAGSVPDSALLTMLGPLGMLRNAAALAQGQPTPAPVMPMSAALQSVANRVAPQPTTARGQIARTLLSMAIPLPGPVKEEQGAQALQKVMQAAERAHPQITAYHGSPHQFEKFDAAKIGTGEGAQVYGHGLYLAENEDVAKAYRDTLSDGVRMVDGQGSNAYFRDMNMDDPMNQARAHVVDMTRQWPVERQIADYEEAIAEHSRQLSEPSGYESPQFDKEYRDTAQANLERAQRNLAAAHELKGRAEFKSDGHLYQVGINAHPDHFLDWDKSLRLQPQALAALEPHRAAIEQQMERAGTMARTLEAAPGATAYHFLGEAHGGPEAAAAALHQAGIPGIKYLDQGSRGVGDGTRNFVVFDPANIEILKRYGIAATALGGTLAAGATAPQQQQSQPTRFGF